MISFPNLGRLGRLGNQLFQIASTIGIARKNNHIYAFPEWEYQEFFTNRLPSAKLLVKDVGTEKGCNYEDLSIPQFPRPIGLHGYFQSEKYFKHCEEEIKKYFFLSTEIHDLIRSKYEKVLGIYKTFIHVRRGDYKKLPQVYYLQDADYYKKCLELCGEDKFAIFTDDPEWCKEKFSEFDYFLVNEREHKKNLSTSESEGESKKFLKEDVIEFALMTKFENSIIANSSFSWWAAWLNLNPNKRVFAPKNWYKEDHVKKIYNTSENYNYRNDLLPKSWTLV